jgi:hypothetical protein
MISTNVFIKNYKFSSMNKYTKFAVFVVLGVTLAFSPHTSHAYYSAAPAAVNKFSTTVNTNKKNYGAGEPIILTGVVKPYEQGRELSIIIRDTASNIIVLKTAPVNTDGTYSYTVGDTTSWKKGNYNVAAQYGTSEVDIGTATFAFDPSVKAEPTPVPAAPAKTEEKAPANKEVKPVKTKEVKKSAKEAKEAKKKPVKETKKAAKKTTTIKKTKTGY